MKKYGEVTVYVHKFLTSARYGGEWWASRPSRFSPGGTAPTVAEWVPDQYRICEDENNLWLLSLFSYSVSSCVIVFPLQMEGPRFFTCPPRSHGLNCSASSWCKQSCPALWKSLPGSLWYTGFIGIWARHVKFTPNSPLSDPSAWYQLQSASVGSQG
jgi:hypothetical protein